MDAAQKAPSAPRGPGRPEHVPTAESRERVRVGAGGGMSHEGLAMVLGISRPTLLKHYAFELGAGAHDARLEVIEAMREVALRKGNVAAAKLYLQFAPEEGELAPVQDGDVPAEPEEPKLGKKAQAEEDAKGADRGTEWEGLLPAHNVVAMPKR